MEDFHEDIELDDILIDEDMIDEQSDDLESFDFMLISSDDENENEAVESNDQAKSTVALETSESLVKETISKFIYPDNILKEMDKYLKPIMAKVRKRADADEQKFPMGVEYGYPLGNPAPWIPTKELVSSRRPIKIYQELCSLLGVRLIPQKILCNIIEMMIENGNSTLKLYRDDRRNKAKLLKKIESCHLFFDFYLNDPTIGLHNRNEIQCNT